jgi:hypothetical protein
MRVLLLCALLLFLSLTPALANGEILDAGPPVSGDLNTESVPDIYDIYTRQIAYYHEQKKLKDQLHERQRNYYAPQKEIRDNYAENREAMWQSAGPDNE